MSVAIVTGSLGLIGSETVKFLHEKGFEVVGIDNDMRAYFFGPSASTAWNQRNLKTLKGYSHHEIDIRDRDKIFSLFASHGQHTQLVVHSAAQPSHDWAAKEPFTDFSINANGTLVLLEATRTHCPQATFIFLSTNKVYGDSPNSLPLREQETRFEVDTHHPFAQHGIDESMSIDHSKHSLFGASKAAADLLTQEYGRYFGLKTGSFRCGCLTGPSHSGAELHGFLAYLIQCLVTGTPYKVSGYKGKQVRDNIHAYDLITAFWEFFLNPRPGEVYNMGGSRHSNCSMLEAIETCQQILKRKLKYEIVDKARSGDHQWWISDVRKFQADYPAWKYRYTLNDTLTEMISALSARHAA